MARPFPSGAGSDKNGVGAVKGQQSPADPGRGQGWLLPIVLFVVVLGIYLLTVAHDWLSLDVWSAHFGAWSIATTGSPSVDGAAMPPLEDTPLREQFVRESVNGHLAITRAAGVVAAGIPAYWLLGEATFTPWQGGVTAALLTAVSVLLVFRTLESRLPRRTAALAAAAFALTTPVWSVAANGIWPHTLTILGITGMAWASSASRWWLVGFFGGIALLGRLHVAVIVAILGLLVAWARRDPRIVLRVGVGSAAFVVVLCAWNYWVYGTWSPSAAYETSMFAEYARNKGFELAPNQLGTWFAPDRGLFVWTPVLLVLAPALVRSWKNLPDWSRALVWGGLAYSVLQCLLDDYDGGYGFYGYRLGLEMLACITPAVALSAPRAGRLARRLIGPALAVQLCAIAIGAIADTPTMLRPGNGWHENLFLTTIADMGPVGWALILGVMLLGVWVSRLWVDLTQPSRAEPSTPAGP